MITCDVCPQLCELNENQLGACRVRKCVNSAVVPIAQNWASSLCYDPVEKKNIYHWYPGKYVLSVGGWGCNYACEYCFAGDTMLLTDKGPMVISSLFDVAENISSDSSKVRVGTNLNIKVVSASGKLQNIERVVEREYSGSMAHIKPYYLPELKCTPEHKVLCSDGTSVPDFKCASDLQTSDYLVTPKLLNTIARKIKFKENDEYYLVPIRSIDTKEYSGLVYDIEVENEHTFLANMMGVHNCMNSRISQSPLKINLSRKTEPESILNMLESGERDCVGVHFGYSEPTIIPEWIIETAAVVKPKYKLGVGTNGFMTSTTRNKLLPIVDQWQLSFRGFDPDVIELITHIDGSLAKRTALESLESFLSSDCHVEVTYIVIPDVTDGPQLENFFESILDLSPDIPVHLLAHSPHFKDRWTIPTLHKMVNHVELGRGCGLNYVYGENVGNEFTHTTKCPTCKSDLLIRDDLSLLERNDKHGICMCGEHILMID